MEDNKQIQQINEATREIVTSLREGSQTIADSVLTIQDRNLRFTQGLFSNWIELLTHQMESVQLLQQQWGQQIQKQQGAFQRLMPASMQISMDLLRAPFSCSRQLVDTTETVMQQERKQTWQTS